MVVGQSYEIYKFMYEKCGERENALLWSRATPRSLSVSRFLLSRGLPARVVQVLLLQHSPLLVRARVRDTEPPARTRGILGSPPAARLKARRHRVRLCAHMRERRLPHKQVRLELGERLDEVVEVRRLHAELVRRRRRDAYLVVRARAHLLRLLRNLAQQPEPLLARRRAALDELDELVDLGRQGGNGRREHGVELAEVSKDAGKVEWEGVEGLCIVCEEIEGVGA